MALADDVNEHMPEYVVARVAAKLNSMRTSPNGSRVLVLGLSYKKNSRDARESPAIAVVNRLIAAGVHVEVADPLVAADDVPAGASHVDLDASTLQRADLVVVLTDHDGFAWPLVVDVAEKVLDTRNRLSGTAAELL